MNFFPFFQHSEVLYRLSYIHYSVVLRYVTFNNVKNVTHMIKTTRQQNNNNTGRMALPASLKAFFRKHPNYKPLNNKQKSGRKTCSIIFYFLLFAFPLKKVVFLPAPFPLKIKTNNNYIILNKGKIIHILKNNRTKNRSVKISKVNS